MRRAASMALVVLAGCGGGHPATAGPDAATVAAARRAIVAPLFRDARTMRSLAGRPYSVQRASLMRMAARLRAAARRAPNTDAPPFGYLSGEAQDIAMNARVPFTLDAYLRGKAGRLERLARYSLTPEHARPLQERWLIPDPQLPTSGGVVRWTAQWDGTVNGCYALIGSGALTGDAAAARRGAGFLQAAVVECRRPRGPLFDRRGTGRVRYFARREGPARFIADRQRYLLVRTHAGGCFTFTPATARLRRTARTSCRTV